MATQELMVGDWVQIGEADNYHGYVGKVKIINSITGYVTVFISDGNLHDVLIDDLEPIQLTNDILKMNGWKREVDKKVYMSNYEFENGGKNYWLMWCVKEHNLEVQSQDDELGKYNLSVRRVVIPCDYVHELQHSLRMIGFEKELTL